MLDRKQIRKDQDRVREGIRKKGVDFDLDSFLALDERMRRLIQETEQLKHERNVVSKEISGLKKEKKDDAAAIARMQKTAKQIKEIDAELKKISASLDEQALAIPNIPHESVPYGTCPDHNVEIRRWGEIAEPPEKPLPHWEIGERLGILDLAGGAKLSGRGFVVLKGAVRSIHGFKRLHGRDRSASKTGRGYVQLREGRPFPYSHRGGTGDEYSSGGDSRRRAVAGQVLGVQSLLQA